MEPHREEQKKLEEPRREEKPKRFRLVRLEERLAPAAGGNGSNKHCSPFYTLYCGGGSLTCSIE